jgi:hypothetical protein
MNRAQAKQMRMLRSEGKVGLRTMVRVSGSEEETRNSEFPGKTIQFNQLENHGTMYHVYLKFEGFPNIGFYTTSVAVPSKIPGAVERGYKTFVENQAIRKAIGIHSEQIPKISQIVLEVAA